MANIREKIYEEVGANYRFFLGWRHAAFAGYLVVVGATISFTASAYNDSPRLAFLFPLGAFPIGLLLCVIDRRNRSLYSAVQRAGASLERPAKGSYARIAGVAAPEGISPWRLAFRGKWTHSVALEALFCGGSVALLLLAGWLWLESYTLPITQKTSPIGITQNSVYKVHLRRDALAVTSMSTNTIDTFLTGHLLAADPLGIQLRPLQSTDRILWIPTSSILYIEIQDKP